jgi:enoyl-CoA hydratase
MADVLQVEHRGPVALVTLSRPDRLNAFDDDLFTAWDDALTRLEADDTVRVIVVTGAGRGFCAGLDLDAATTLDRLDAKTFLDRQREVSRSLTRPFLLTTPVIAAVNGPASGGGLAIALASDIRVCSPEATFNVAFVRIGLTGCDVGVSYLLPRVVGLGAASEMMLTGRRVGADEALRLGLVTHVVPEAELLARALTIGEEIAANSAFGVSLTKEGLRLVSDATSLEAALGIENRQQALAALGPDYAAAVQAFLKGRS